MCIAVYKPMGADFPVKRVLKRCFYKNPDGAGFMVANGSEVEIRKGYMGFRSFWKALREVRAEYGDDKAYVMHFRISTQGGVRQDGCHPFPLSSDMNDMRLLRCNADIGIAHNGIIDLCTDWSSTYSSWYSKSYSVRNSIDYSDTMKFITEYLSLIIHDREYYKNVDTLRLINKLGGSRFAILDSTGHCELIGSGWEQSDGVWYSNSGYKAPEVTAVDKTATTSLATYSGTYRGYNSYSGTYRGYNSYSDYWEEWYNERDGTGFSDYEDKDPHDPYSEYLTDEGLYDFSQSDCPATLDGDDSYCADCKQLCACWKFDEKYEVS